MPKKASNHTQIQQGSMILSIIPQKRPKFLLFYDKKRVNRSEIGSMMTGRHEIKLIIFKVDYHIDGLSFDTMPSSHF